LIEAIIVFFFRAEKNLFLFVESAQNAVASGFTGLAAG